MMILIFSDTTQAVHTLDEATAVTNINPFDIAKAIESGDEIDGYTFDTDGFVISSAKMRRNAMALLDDSRLGIVAVYNDKMYAEFVGSKKNEKKEWGDVIHLRREDRASC